MNRISRRVAWDLICVFAIALSALTALMVMVFLIQEGLREKLTPATILLLIPYTIPTALCFAIPGTMLFSVCVVYGRMSAHNEVLAIKAMGIPATRIVWPALIIAFLLSLFTLYLNDLAASWGRRGIYRVVLRSSAETIYAALRAQGSFNKGRISIMVDDVRGGDLINPLIERHTFDASDRLRIQAEIARIKVDPLREHLIVQIQNGRIEYGNQMSISIDRKDIPIPLGDATKKDDMVRSPSDLALREVASESRSQSKLTEELKSELAFTAAAQLLGGNLVGLTHPKWHNEWLVLDAQLERGHRLKTEPWRRWANGFSCLCFVIVGVPLAIRLGKSDFWTIFAICFLPILLAYYPLLMFGVERAKSGDLPPYCVWIGNTVMIIIGICLNRHIQRH